MMKTILMPTDFSHASVNAVKYGISMARSFYQKVILFNSYWVPMPAMDVPVIAESADMKLVATNKLERMALELGAPVLDNIEVDCQEGSTVRNILGKVRSSNAQLVVAGVKPHHKAARKIFGSTVTDLIQHIRIPMIVVPENVSYSNIGTIALAFETDAAFNTNPHLLDTLIAIATHFHARVYVVRVANKKIRESFEYVRKPYRIVRMIKSIGPIVEEISAENVEEGLKSFISHHHVDMLAVLPHEHTLLERLFKMTTTERLIDISSVPLLLLPPLPPVKVSLARNFREAIL